MFHVEREQLTHPILDPEELTGLRACYRLMREEARIMQQIDRIFSSAEVFQTEEAWALVDDAERVGLCSHPMVRLLRTKIDGEAGPSSVTGVKRDWRFKTVGRLTTDRRVSIASVAQYIRKPSTPPQELTFPSCRGAFCLNKQSSEIASTNEHAAIRKKTSATNEHAAIQERTSATNERAAIRKKTSAIVDSDWCSPFRTDESRKTDFSQDADESNLKISKAEHIWKKGSPMQKWANSTKVPLPPSVLLNALRVRRQKEALEGSIVGPRRRTLNEILEVRRKESLVRNDRQ